uniref:WSN domain-containing protein n=1 Tax=Panagrellus redivivus TaxID=6233 RepID=A0A7E4V4C7_PANRE
MQISSLADKQGFGGCRTPVVDNQSLFKAHLVTVFVNRRLPGRMFCRTTIVILCLVVSYVSAGETIDFLRALTSEDHEILMSIVRHHEKYENLDQALEDIKAKSAELYTKVLNFKNFITDTIEKLDDDAKKFVKETIMNLYSALPAYGGNDSGFYNALSNTLMEARKKYNNLSNESKSSLKEHLPDETAFIERLEPRL